MCEVLHTILLPTGWPRGLYSLKQSLKATVNDDRTLVQRLSSYLLTYRTTPHATTGVPPCKLLMQRELRTRFSLLQPDTEKTVVEKQLQQKSAFDRRTRLRSFENGDRVLVRDFRSGRNWTTAVVIEVLGPVTYIVQTDEGQRWKRHVDQMRKFVNRSTTESAVESNEINSEVGFDRDGSVDTGAHSDSPVVDTPDPSGTIENDTAASDSEDAPEPTETVGRRYPTRSRHPPNYYQN